MRKISAIFAAIAMTLMSVFALAPSAFADDYSATVNANPNADGTATITVTLDDATYDAGYHYVGVTVDDSLVSNVTVAAEKTYGWWAASENTPHTVTIKLTTLNCKDAKVTVEASKSADGADAITVGSQTVNFPATCSVNGNTNAGAAAAGSNSGNTAQTGASVVPYVIVVALLAIAGVAFLALRKKSR
ncbi:hypothetical protein G1C98_1127 [Bifidobacterium sp. DSM 109960]|uniref:Uncharacterized protein n=1 Tax=Bifidobacterium erythrocebi TaxID=2675325 RepID=A0A7Y0HUP3_9BIFI|nr:hypothetical protein [Bifidobacterium sp. DSM 109960]NMM96391.1 hypothetical protein [Bifidobacterium sp. DSM 109960]